MKITDCITCPKCHTPFLKKASSPKSYMDWFCHKCKTNFSTHELVNQWGLDAGDLFGNIDSVPRSGMTIKSGIVSLVVGSHIGKLGKSVWTPMK